ncbi:MFS transporter [Paenarthrobacter sp. NPDC089675]|uniref:MFS transporter n=1 Tax=Paenarthrobacter sp. NPDC089675 TaxID=3364376 RepID=UPI003809EB79
MQNRVLVVFVLLLASFMDLLDSTIVNVALPAIQSDLGASPEQLEWTVNGYVLAFAVLLISGGRLGDIFGRKKTFIAGVIGFTLASALGVVAANADILIGARVGQGAFAALMIPQVLSMIQVLFEPKERAGMLGALGAVSGLAAIAGPLVGGALVSADLWGFGWRSILVINIPVGVILLVASAISMPDSKSPKAVRLDLLGFALATSALLLAVFALIEARSANWAPWIWAMFVAAAVLIVAFVGYQRRVESDGGTSLMPLELFSSRGYSAGVVAQLSFAASVAAFMIVTSLYLQLTLGFSAMETGLATLPFAVGAFIGSIVAVQLGPRLGRTLILFGAAAQIAGYFWASRTVADMGQALHGSDLLIPLAIAGAGLTLQVVPLTDLTLSSAPVAHAGAASGVFNTFQQVGTALGVALVGVIYFSPTGGTGTSIDAYVGGMWVPLVALCVSALACTLLPGVAAANTYRSEVEAAESAEDREVAAT